MKYSDTKQLLIKSLLAVESCGVLCKHGYHYCDYLEYDVD